MVATMISRLIGTSLFSSDGDFGNSKERFTHRGFAEKARIADFRFLRGQLGAPLRNAAFAIT